MFDKNEIRGIIPGAAVTDVVYDCPANEIGKRKFQRFLRFLLDQGQFFVIPVEVREPEVLDIADPKAQHTCQQYHGVVTLADRTVPVNNADQLFQLISCPGRRYRSLFRDGRHVDLRRIVFM